MSGEWYNLEDFYFWEILISFANMVINMVFCNTDF